MLPAALDSIRGIGELRAETSREDEDDGITQVENLLVISVGAIDEREALDKAASLLVARGWMIVAENRPVIVSMESVKWEHTHLALRPFSPDYLEEYPEILRKLEIPIEGESLVYIEVLATAR
nr:hypothetical protein GCM10020093_011540 [Planobispora longispora]